MLAKQTQCPQCCHVGSASLTTMGSTKRRPRPTSRCPSPSGGWDGRVLRAVGATSAVQWTMLSPPIERVALACTLMLVAEGGPNPAVTETLFVFRWPSIVASAMRILRNLRQCSPHPLAAAALVCVLLLIFNASLGFPGEGPTGIAPKHDSRHAYPRHAQGSLCACRMRARKFSQRVCEHHRCGPRRARRDDGAAASAKDGAARSARNNRAV